MQQSCCVDVVKRRSDDLFVLWKRAACCLAGLMPSKHILRESEILGDHISNTEMFQFTL